MLLSYPTQYRGAETRSIPHRSEHDGTRAVPEEHRSAAVAVVKDAGIHVYADHEGVRRAAPAEQEATRHLCRVDEPAAHRVEVEHGAAAGADQVLDQIGRRWLRMVGC